MTIRYELRTDRLDVHDRARALELEEADPEQLAWHAACLEQDVEALEAEVERLRNAVAEEREACALVCEQVTAAWSEMEYNEGCMDCSKAIRARGDA